MNKEQEELVLSNLALVSFVYNKYFTKYDYLNIRDELISEGNVGLCKAANSFDGSRNIKFSSYATRCISNQMRMYLRRNKSLFNEVSAGTGSTEYNADVVNELHIEDVEILFNLKLNQIMEYESDKVNDRIDLVSAYEKLPIRYQYILKELFLGGRTQKDLGDRIGLSQAVVSRYKKRAIKYLKAIMEDNQCTKV